MDLDVSQLRKTSAVAEFPWHGITLIYISNGAVRQATSLTEKRALLAAAEAEGGTLLAPWPGEYSTDVFAVDNLAEAIHLMGMSAAKAMQERLNNRRKA
ncbi:MAG: hypothetical protein ACRDRJ_15875 [Streptosporangiaceae bacterium]